MVLIHGLPDEFVKIVLGQRTGSWQLALTVGLTGLFLIGVFHAVISWFSLPEHHYPQRGSWMSITRPRHSANPDVLTGGPGTQDEPRVTWQLTLRLS